MLTQQEEKEMWVALEQYGEIEGIERKAKKNSGYADPTPTMGWEGDGRPYEQQPSGSRLAAASRTQLTSPSMSLSREGI